MAPKCESIGPVVTRSPVVPRPSDWFGRGGAVAGVNAKATDATVLERAHALTLPGMRKGNASQRQSERNRTGLSQQGRVPIGRMNPWRQA